MGSKEIYYPESRFGGFTDLDGTLLFYSRVNALIDESSTVLDIGCGRGCFQDDPVKFKRDVRNLKGKVARVVGIDVDEAAEDNPYLDAFYRIEGKRWPLAGDSIDLIICDFVLEHVAEPEEFFAEAQRVLKNGGYICIRTPNSWGYVAFFSKIIPNRSHAKVLEKVQDARKAQDVFPTFYKCNSIWKLRANLKRAGFDAVVYGYEAEPLYLAFSRFAYWLGTLHQRFAPGFMKPTIFAFGKIEKGRR